MWVLVWNGFVVGLGLVQGPGAGATAAVCGWVGVLVSACLDHWEDGCEWERMGICVCGCG